MNRRLVAYGLVIGTVVTSVAFAGSGWASDGLGLTREHRPGGPSARLAGPHRPVTVKCGDVAGLKAAIHAANANPTQPATIKLAPHCRYTLTSADNGANGLPVVQSPLTIRGKRSTIVRSSAAGTPAFRIWQVGANGALTLRSVTIAGGEAPAGGGIYNDGGRLTLERSAVRQNTATASGDAAGGGIYNTGTVTIVRSELDANDVTSADGVAAGGGLENRGSALLSITRIRRNTTHSSGDSAIGSAIDNAFGATLTVNFSRLDHNAASSPTFAGGTAIDNGGTATLHRSDVSHNAATSSGTAAAALYQVGPLLRIDASRVYGNTATSPGVAGGGIYTGGGLDVVDSEVFGNTAHNTSADGSATGAGIFVVGGTARLTGSTVTRNKAVGPNAHGGGIAKIGVAMVILTASTVTANVPDNCYPPGSIAGCVG
jgi:hypothetical protein